jgi:UDP-glucose 4-epimerase
MTKESSSLLTPHSSPKPLIRWLITGGCGFIGLNLVKNLIEEGGHYIRIVDDLSVGTREDLSQVCNFTEINPKSLNSQSFSTASNQTKPDALRSGLCAMPAEVDLIVADILDAEFALKAAEGIDVIVHLAANAGVPQSVKDPRIDCVTNIIGTLNYLEAARHNHVKRLIFASSNATVGECTPPIHEELAPHPVSPYGASKLASESYCSAYYHTYGLETVSLRFGNVYGKFSSNKNSVVAKFIKRVLEGKPLEIYGDGTQTRDFIYIDDLIQAIRLSIVSDQAAGETFQISTNKETTICELVNKLLAILKDLGFRNVKTYNVAHRLGDVRRNFADTSKAKRILSWESKTELKDGLKKTAQWFFYDNFSKRSIKI